MFHFDLFLCATYNTTYICMLDSLMFFTHVYVNIFYFHLFLFFIVFKYKFTSSLRVLYNKVVLFFVYRACELVHRTYISIYIHTYRTLCPNFIYLYFSVNFSQIDSCSIYGKSKKKGDDISCKFLCLKISFFSFSKK